MPVVACAGFTLVLSAHNGIQQFEYGVYYMLFALEHVHMKGTLEKPATFTNNEIEESKFKTLHANVRA